MIQLANLLIWINALSRNFRVTHRISIELYCMRTKEKGCTNELLFCCFRLWASHIWQHNIVEIYPNHIDTWHGISTHHHLHLPGNTWYRSHMHNASFKRQTITNIIWWYLMIIVCWCCLFFCSWCSYFLHVRNRRGTGNERFPRWLRRPLSEPKDHASPDFIALSPKVQRIVQKSKDRKNCPKMSKGF